MRWDGATGTTTRDITTSHEERSEAGWGEVEWSGVKVGWAGLGWGLGRDGVG